MPRLKPHSGNRGLYVAGVMVIFALAVAGGWLVHEAFPPDTSSLKAKASIPGSEASSPAPPPVLASREEVTSHWDEVAPVKAESSAAMDPRFAPRDPTEWQGRLVDVSVKEPCNEFGSCGLARACLSEGTCGPCEFDSDCVVGEACVFQNSLRAERVECRSRSECAADDLCIIETEPAVSNTWRGNENLFSACSASGRVAAAALAQQTQEASAPSVGVGPEPIDRAAMQSELARFAAEVSLPEAP